MLYDDGRNVRLLYELEVPVYPQEAQEVLAIYKTGDYSVQVRVRQCLCLCSKSSALDPLQHLSHLIFANSEHLRQQIVAS